MAKSAMSAAICSPRRRERRSGLGGLSLAFLIGSFGCGPSGGESAADGGAGETPPADAGGTVCRETCSVTFGYARAPGDSRAELRGDFRVDGWREGVEMTLAGGEFSATLELEHGQLVEYKFLVDGERWELDSDNPSRRPTADGSENSVLEADCGCESDRFDWRDAIMYFVVLDRFADGDPSNNRSVPGVPNAANYQGGDLRGLRAKIEEGYFDELGINVLWITSPIDNADGAGDGSDGRNFSAYHGYWPRDLSAVESRVGTMLEMREMVDAAHARGIRVLIDYVMNHVHDESPLYAEHPEWFWENDNGRGADCICGEGCSWEGDEGRKCWFRDYLPDFKFQNAAARAWSIDNAIEWAERTGVDGFRLDAVKQVETSWLVELRDRLREGIEAATGEIFYLIGETYTGDAELIASYVDPLVMLDGQFDFPLRAALARTILRRAGSMNELALFLAANDDVYHPDAVMGTFLGNHDLPRAIHLAEDPPLFGDWDAGQERAWEGRPEQPSAAAPYERLAVAFALLFTNPGIPLVYYGDEVGLAGAGDPDNRRFMPWGELLEPQRQLRESVRRLAALRASHPALRRGVRKILGATGEVLSYELSLGGEQVIAALNRGDLRETAVGIPPGPHRDLIAERDVEIPIELAPRSFAILAPLP